MRDEILKEALVTITNGKKIIHIPIDDLMEIIRNSEI